MALARRSNGADQGLMLLVGATLLTGIAALILSVVWITTYASARPSWVALVLLAALVLVCDFLLVKVRVRSTIQGVAWTDASILVVLAAVDFPWAVPVTLAGTLAAGLIAGRQPVKLAFGVAKDVTMVTVGGLLLLALTTAVDTAGVAVWLAQLALAFLAMAVVDQLITVPVIAFATRTRVRARFRADWDIHLLTRIGRMVVALAAVLMLELEDALLYALPLVVLMAHLWHERWVRAREERQAWENLAAATEHFTGVDLNRVLHQAVLKGTRLFSADQLEVEVWLGEERRLVRGTDEIVYDGEPDQAPAEPGEVYAAPLHGYQGRRDIGVLRLRFRNRVKTTEREEAMVSAYAAALDTAVRNAAAYRQLGEATQAHAHAAAHDALTGLANRRELERQLAEALADPESLDCRVAVVLIDLRHFKEVNDALGHLTGDRVLERVAQRLVSGAGPNDLVSRFGGDEFAVLLRGAWRRPRVQSRAQRILRTLAEPIEVDGLPIMVEANGGLALAVDPEQPAPAAAAAAGEAPAGEGAAQTWLAELLRRADVAMYQAKRRGRPLLAYTAAHDPADRERLTLAGRLPRAVAQREFVLHFQPIVDLATGEVGGAEALARWRHPTRGELGPGAFLELLERSVHLPAFTGAVLDDALAAAEIWRAAGHDLRVAVNISPRSLLDASFPEQVLAALDRHQTSPTKLCLELTETLALSQLETVDQVLTQLHDLGVQLALDDFGTGYSSLALLSRIPVHQLKVDRSFVQALVGDGWEQPAEPSPGEPAGEPAGSPLATGQAKAVVRSTVQLAHTLELAVVAEGIESEQQRRLLWELGCPAGQGHLFSRPCPADRLLAKLTSGVDGRPGALAQPLAPEPGVVPLPRPRRPGQRSAG